MSGPNVFSMSSQNCSGVYGRGSPPSTDADRLLDSFTSCGISQLWHLYATAPAEAVAKIMEQRSGADRTSREAFVQWSDIDKDINGMQKENGGHLLAAYIRANNLGALYEMGPRMNPNTGNYIKLWVWEPPHKSLHPKDKVMPKKGYRRRFVANRFYDYVEGAGSDVYE